MYQTWGLACRCRTSPKKQQYQALPAVSGKFVFAKQPGEFTGTMVAPGQVRAIASASICGSGPCLQPLCFRYKSAQKKPSWNRFFTRLIQALPKKACLPNPGAPLKCHRARISIGKPVERMAAATYSGQFFTQNLGNLAAGQSAAPGLFVSAGPSWPGCLI
jgi:hypothetical protein